MSSSRKIRLGLEKLYKAIRDKVPAFLKGTLFVNNANKETGVTHKPSAPNTQAQNGYAERAGRQLVVTARKTFIASGLPDHLWGYFIKATVRVLNETPIQRTGWTTPHEIVFGKKPDCSGVRILGPLVYVLRKGTSKALAKNPRLQKLKSVSVKGWYLGRSASNIFEVWIPEVNKHTWAHG